MLPHKNALLIISSYLHDEHDAHPFRESEWIDGVTVEPEDLNEAMLFTLRLLNFLTTE